MTEYGFLRVGAAVPNVRVADVDYNLNGIIEIVKDADHKECDVVVFRKCLLRDTPVQIYLCSPF